VKEAIDAEQQRKALMKEKNDIDIEMMEDPVPMITKRHFEVGLSHCRKSVTESDLSRYEEFKSKFDPNFAGSNKNENKIIWPDGDGKAHEGGKKDEEDLDLYD